MKRRWTILSLASISALILTGLVLIIARADPGQLYATPGGTGDCSTWANACDLQTALATATAGDEIWVAAGTHQPTTDTLRTATFELKPGVALYGGFAATETLRTERDWEANVTILSGDIGTPGDASDNVYHVVSSDGVTQSAVLDGFTVTGGNADDLFNHPSGGGMNNNDSSPTVANVVFEGNHALMGGGGMHNNNSSYPSVFNVVFEDNTTDGNGAGMYNNNSSGPLVVNTVFVNNTAGNDGGGMYNDNSSAPSVVNVTFYENTAGNAGGGLANVRSGSSRPDVSNTIFWGNTAPANAQIYDPGSALRVNYCLVEGGYSGGTGNVSGGPEFIDAANGDFRLQPGSAAIDAGDNTAVPLDLADLDGDSNTTEQTPIDLATATRFLDVAGTADTGNGTAPLVDIGAYEASFIDLVLDKVVEPAGAVPGQPVTYTITFSNAGSLDAAGVVITDIVPADLVDRSVSNTGATLSDTGATPPYVWDVTGGLAPGEWGVITITGRVDPALVADTTMDNAATIVTTDEDIDPTNNDGQGSTSVTVPQVQLSSASYTAGESDGSATITVTLDTANPYVDVTVEVASSDVTATAGQDYVAVSETLTVTAGTTRATFTVPILSDQVDEEDEDLTLTLSNPAGAGLNAPSSATLTIEDDDTAGTEVAPTALTVSEPSGSDTFTITLDSQPTAPVTISMTPSNTQCDVPDAVALDETNWDTGVVVTVNAVDDWIDDGSLLCVVETAAASDDTDYDGIVVDDVDVTVEDDDTAGTVVDPTTLTVSEPSGSDTFTITLTSEPTATVTVSMNTSNAECSVPSTVTLDAANWETGVAVTVSAVDDWIDDGDLGCTVETVASSDDGDYDAIPIDDVTITVVDDDSAGITVAPTSFTVSEPSGSSTFSITLDSEPTAPVTITLTPTDTTECQALASQVVLDAGNWNTGVEVTVEAVDEDVDDGPQTCVIETGAATSSDTNYQGTDPDDVVVTVQDEDTAGIGISPTALTVVEPDTTEVFTIVLESEPTAPVTITLTSTDTTECQPLVPEVVLDASNWASGVVVTVQAVDDDLDDGPQTCVIETGAATSDDPNYHGKDLEDVTLSVQDEDDAGTIVMPTTLHVVEGGTVDHFQVTLTSEPTDAVTVTVAVDGETWVDTPEIVFLPSNWDTPQIVTVHAVDDSDGEWDHAGLITNTVSSSDPDYDGVAISNIDVVIADDDIRHVYTPMVFNP